LALPKASAPTAPDAGIYAPFAKSSRPPASSQAASGGRRSYLFYTESTEATEPDGEERRVEACPVRTLLLVRPLRPRRLVAHEMNDLTRFACGRWAAPCLCVK
jgi:hypothetical protein